MTDGKYLNPLSTPTVTMTVAGILQWLDLEVGYLKAKHDAEENETVKLILMGTWLHLNVMKEQLENYALQQLDEEQNK